MKRLSILLIVGVFILSACGSDSSAEESTGLEAASDNTEESVSVAENNDDSSVSDTLLASLDEPIAGDFTFPELPLDGRILFIQGNTDTQSSSLGEGGKLYLAAFDGSTPQKIATRISEPSIMISPDGNKVAYVAAEGRSFYMYVMDLQTLESIQLQRLTNRFGFVASWSLDSEWLVFRNQAQSTVSNIDGSIQYELGQVFTFWLEDGRLIVLQAGNFFGNRTQPVEVDDFFVLDPASGDRTDLQFPSDTVIISQFPFVDLKTIADELGTSFASNMHGDAGVFGFPIVLMSQDEFALDLSDGQFAPNSETCLDIGIEAFEYDTLSEPYELISTTQTLGLSDFDQLPNGDIMLKRWYLDDCVREAENLHIEVIRTSQDGSEHEIIVEGIWPGISTQFLRGSTARKYDLSPNGDYIVWIEGSLESLRTNINLTNLETGDTAGLLTWQSDSSNDFLIWEAINGVFWVR